MDLLTENVSAGLVKYLRILQGSKKFKERMEALKFKHFQKQNSLKNADELDESFNSILKDFFIPVTEANASYLLSYSRVNAPSEKYSVHIDLLASAVRPHSFKIDEPCVIVKVRDEMNSREWAKMKSDLVASTKKLHGISVLSSLRKEHSLPKAWENIDLLLEIYARRDHALPRLCELLPQIKVDIGHRLRPTHSVDEIRKMRDQISELIDSL